MNIPKEFYSDELTVKTVGELIDLLNKLPPEMTVSASNSDEPRLKVLCFDDGECFLEIGDSENLR